MRIMIQRVDGNMVSVKGKVIGKINKGYFVLLGVKKGDTRKDADFLTEKLSKLRVMSDKDGKMNLSLKDAGGGVLVVSQFTLHASTKKGNRPSFVGAADPAKAEELYNYFIKKLKSLDVRVETGEFGAMMTIDARLDGPVTIIIDSNNA